ncbi:hypothetical protein [Corynebacterium halotolerans]|uniref:hypothetical protein n=1 Tax=Corynebacterium halotolerans TaxID=225326 RepID=UPI003CF8E703
MINSITQALTTAPLWLQAPIVFAVVLPLCVTLAVVLVRSTDAVGRLFASWYSRRGIGEDTGNH